MKKPILALSVARALARQRKQIDSADRALLRALAKRLAAVREIGLIKQTHRLPLLQRARWQELVADRLGQGERLGLNGSFVRAILNVIHTEAIRLQNIQRRSSKRKNL